MFVIIFAYMSVYLSGQGTPDDWSIKTSVLYKGNCLCQCVCLSVWPRNISWFEYLFNYPDYRFSGVPQAMIDTEVWVPFDREYPAENEVVADVGSIGFTGRLVIGKHRALGV